MIDEIKKVKLEVVEDGGVAQKISIPKPGPFCLDDFKSEHAPADAGVETLQTALPHHTLKDARDFVQLHPDQATHWSPALCFVTVPVKGVRRDVLHLIVEKLAMRYLPSDRIERFRLALASKPHDVFFLAHIPTQNTDNTWVASHLIAVEQARTHWVQVTSRRPEGVDAYKGTLAKDPDAFPEPKWPQQSITDLIDVTFAGCKITTEDHPGLLRLIGAKPQIS